MNRDYILENQIRYTLDGAMGTYYMEITGENEASEPANVANPDIIERIHSEYIEAGAQIIRTNTFAANTIVLGKPIEEINSIVRMGCRIAKQAVAKSKKKVLIAASIGPIPMQGEEQEEILKEYQTLCDIMISEGVDAIWFETFENMSVIKELIPYIRAKPDLFIHASFCIDKFGYTRDGISMNRILLEMGRIDELSGLGFNCGVGSGHMLTLVKKMVFPKNKVIAIVPNASYPEQLHNRLVFRDNIGYYRDNMELILQEGVSIAGACCGSNPGYIRSIYELTNTFVFTKLQSGHSIETRELSEQKKKENQEEVTTKSYPANAFIDKLKAGKKVVAVELDPPYDIQYDNLVNQADIVKRHGVDIITFADSPGGRSRIDSVMMGIKIAKQVGLDVMPHISCRDKNMIAMRSTLLGAHIHDIRNLLLVTGDPVPSVSRSHTSNVFDYNSIRLMQFVKEMNEEHLNVDPFYYGGALNYARGNLDKVIERMKHKIEAGASYFLTQPVYCEEDANRLRIIKSKIDAKILCGVMPFVSYRNANFVRNEMPGIHVPEEIVNRYHPEMSKEEAEMTGAMIANEMINRMQDFADGYYLMLPFNRVSFLDNILLS